jgi:hypothetical protein
MDLPSHAPSLVANLGLLPNDFPLYFNAAIQSIRGTSAASTSDKKRFLESILERMREVGVVRTWEFFGTKGRQDYKIVLSSGRVVAIESKGCPDGNNLNIWERPAWAEEFIVWSQCPQSLAKAPGEGIWSGIATRLLTKVAVEGERVDAFIFHDGQCGAAGRPCWKHHGREGWRLAATDIPAADGRNWLPAPCVYLFPRTVANPRTNRKPALHSLDTCHFARALLEAFGVPKGEWSRYTHWASIELRQDEEGIHKRVAIGHQLGGPSVVESQWTKLKRE